MANNNNLKTGGLFLNNIKVNFPANNTKLILRGTSQCLLSVKKTLDDDNIDDALGGGIDFGSGETGSIVPPFGFPSTGQYTVSYRIQQGLSYINYFGWAHQEGGIWVPNGGFSFLLAMSSEKTVSVGKSDVKFSKTIVKQTVVSAGTERPTPGTPPSPISIGTIPTVHVNYSTYADTLYFVSQNTASVTYDINSGTNSDMLIVLNYLETLSA